MKRFATWYVPATQLSRHRSRRDNNSTRFYSVTADFIQDAKLGLERMDGGWHPKRSSIQRIRFCSRNTVRLLRMPQSALID
ncbi:hypothetical protein ASG42_30825 [Rhizobium sp. Leaf391]|nr:hypothetical protein ASG42_30825 [Rhizobium sp. Leaf391]